MKMLWLRASVHRVDYNVIFSAIDFENEYQTKSHLWLMKLEI